MSHIEQLFNVMLYYYINKDSILTKQKMIQKQISHFNTLLKLPHDADLENDNYIKNTIVNLEKTLNDIEPFNKNLINELIGLSNDDSYLLDLCFQIKNLDYVVIDNASTNIITKITTNKDFEKAILAIQNNDDKMLAKSTLQSNVISYIKTLNISANINDTIDHLMDKYKNDAIDNIRKYLSTVTWKDFFTDYFKCKYTLDINFDNLYYIYDKTISHIKIMHILNGNMLSINENIKNVNSNLIWYDGINKTYVPMSITDEVEINEFNETNEYGIVLCNNYIIKDNCNNIFWQYYIVSKDSLLKYFYYNIIKYIQELNIELDIFNANTSMLNRTVSNKLLNIKSGLFTDDSYLVNMANIN